jgi:hypothetical protein
MKNLIPPEGVTDKELENYLAGLPPKAQKDVLGLLASGAGKAEIVKYIASLGPEPEDELGPPQGQPALRTERSSMDLPLRQHEPAIQKSRSVTARQSKSQPARSPDPISRRRRGKLGQESHEVPPGVQGANIGYWQAGGVTRSGAKRSKRP